MTLTNTRAAFEKAVTDAVADVDPTVEMIYDNMVYKTPGKTKKYIVMSVDFSQSTSQTQGASQDFYSGVIQCNVYIPRGKGSKVLSDLGSANEPIPFPVNLTFGFISLPLTPVPNVATPSFGFSVNTLFINGLS